MPDGSESPGVQHMVGAAGSPAVIRWRGKGYKVGHPTQAAKSRLEELAADTAILRVEAKKGMNPRTHRILLERVSDRVAAGEYRTWQPGWQEIVWSDGGALFLLSLLHEFHDDLTIQDAAAMMDECAPQYKAAMSRVLPSFFEILLKGLEIPEEKMKEVRATISELLTKLNPPPSQPDPTSESTLTS